MADYTVAANTFGRLIDRVRSYGGGIDWASAPGDGTLNPPAVVDGTVFATGLHGTLWAFTP